MKKSILSLLGLALFIMSCEGPQTQIKDILGNDDYRKEIINKIASNYEYMQEMNLAMIENGTAIQIFEASPEMVNHLINNDGMVDLLKNNPEAKENMMSMMLKDTLFNTQLIEKAILDKENTNKMVKQLEANKIITKACANEANTEVEKKFSSVRPNTNK